MSALGACILDADGLRLSAEEKAFFRDANPFGFILFARNVETPDQLRALCADMRDAVGRDAPILVDQEGGRVQRLRAPHWREYQPPLDVIERAEDKSARAIWLQYRLIAEELRAVGIDCNCAPTCDIAGDDTHPFLLNRCLGRSAAEVLTNATAAAAGHLAGGVIPVLKHMPGHGRACADSHKELPHVSVPHDVLSRSDFAVFKAMNGLPAGMSAHVVYDAIDGAPATVSAPMINLIRNEIGFDGVLMTDDISMKALPGSEASKASAARAAGCDLVLFCNAPMDERREVAEASGVLEGDGLRRAEAMLEHRKTVEEIDIAALQAEFQALMGGQGYV